MVKPVVKPETFVCDNDAAGMLVDFCLILPTLCQMKAYQTTT